MLPNWISLALYRVVMRVGPLVAYPALRYNRRARARLGERFGQWGELPSTFMWFHGASFGEVNGLLPLIRAVAERGLSEPMLLSATTTTGVDAGANKVAYTRLLPFDHDHWIQKALGHSRPKAFIFGETELWPSLCAVLAERNVPMALVNGRMSERAFTRYLRIKSSIAPTLQRLSVLCVQTEEAKRRFLELGADPSRVVVSGGAKYDSDPAVTDAVEIDRLRAEFFADDRPVVVLGSLRPGEEEEWFPAIRRALQDGGSSLGFIVAPRHKEKFDFFQQRLRDHELPFHRRSNGKNQNGACSIVLLDTMGELSKVYAFARVAFIGGTLRDYGGHNPLEPAPYGATVVIGPHFQNASDAVELLRANHGVYEIRARDDIDALLSQVRSRDSQLTEIGAAARAVWEAQRGAVQRILTVLVQRNIL